VRTCISTSAVGLAVFGAIFGAIFLVILAPASRAAGDPMELHGYVEPCTVGNEQEMYTQCELCAVPGSSPQLCNDQLGRRGYQKMCRTRGEAAGWSEVWCISTRPVAETPHTPKALIAVAVALLAGASLVTARSWRRRRRAN
jgi:hypothetical protein